MEAEARGEVLDWKAYVPKSVPDDENFAMTPFLAPLFDFLPDRKPGQNLWRDTNGFARAQGFAKNLPYMRETGGWRRAKRTDLAAWLKAFDEKKKKSIAGQDSSETSALVDDPADISVAIFRALSDSKPVIDELATASRRPNARFPVRYDQTNPAGILLPHLSVTKRVCQVLKIRALAALASGETGAAFQDLSLMFYLIDVHQGEPFLISHLVCLANFQLATQVLWEGLADHRFTEQQLAPIQSSFSKLDFLQDMDHSLRSERAFGIKIIDWIRQSPDSAKTLDMMGWGEGSGEWSAMPFWAEFFPRGWFHFEKLNYARLFGEYLLSKERDGLNAVDPERVERKNEDLSSLCADKGKVLRDHMILSAMLLPAMARAEIKAAHAQSTVNEAEMACALERYRIANSAYPEHLENLVPRFIKTLPLDVITAKPMIYRRIDPDRFVLYSIGWNQTDDGGQFQNDAAEDSALGASPSEAKRKKTSGQRELTLDEGDWVWQIPGN